MFCQALIQLILKDHTGRRRPQSTWKGLEKEMKSEHKVSGTAVGRFMWPYNCDTWTSAVDNSETC